MEDLPVACSCRRRDFPGCTSLHMYSLRGQRRNHAHAQAVLALMLGFAAAVCCTAANASAAEKRPRSMSAHSAAKTLLDRCMCTAPNWVIRQLLLITGSLGVDGEEETSMHRPTCGEQIQSPCALMPEVAFSRADSSRHQRHMYWTGGTWGDRSPNMRANSHSMDC